MLCSPCQHFCTFHTLALHLCNVDPSLYGSQDSHVGRGRGTLTIEAQHAGADICGATGRRVSARRTQRTGRSADAAMIRAWTARPAISDVGRARHTSKFACGTRRTCDGGGRACRRWTPEASFALTCRHGAGTSVPRRCGPGWVRRVTKDTPRGRIVECGVLVVLACGTVGANRARGADRILACSTVQAVSDHRRPGCRAVLAGPTRCARQLSGCCTHGWAEVPGVARARRLGQRARR